MKGKFSLYQWLRRVLTATALGGGFAFLVREWTEYTMLGQVNLSATDTAALRDLLSAPGMSDDSLIVIVGIVFGALKGIRNYARNHPDANTWLQAIFGTATPPR